MASRGLQGVFRSLRLYHGPDAPKERMDALYRNFVEPGDLVFDIGAHTGDRVSSFRRLGARVVAVERQPVVGSRSAWARGEERSRRNRCGSARWGTFMAAIHWSKSSAGQPAPGRTGWRFTSTRDTRRLPRPTGRV